MRIWIQGAGEMATGAAVALLAAGHDVVMAEIANPLAVRRLVCFSDAVYETKMQIGPWPGRLVSPASAVFEPGRVAILIDPQAEQLERLDPDVVVDARMTKRRPVALPSGSRPVIGLGPGFTCGSDASLIVETKRGTDLGKVIIDGQAEPYSGLPGDVGGQTISRLLRAPAAGYLVPVFKIGDLVEEGQVIGMVSGLPVVAGLAGLLRGLVHERAELSAGEKVGDIDPRGKSVDPAEMTDKARKVGLGVCNALNSLGH